MFSTKFCPKLNGQSSCRNYCIGVRKGFSLLVLLDFILHSLTCVSCFLECTQEDVWSPVNYQATGFCFVLILAVLQGVCGDGWRGGILLFRSIISLFEAQWKPLFDTLNKLLFYFFTEQQAVTKQMFWLLQGLCECAEGVNENVE